MGVASQHNSNEKCAFVGEIPGAKTTSLYSLGYFL